MTRQTEAMPDALDELLAKIQQEHGPRAIYRPPAMVPARKWTSGLEARCKNERDDDELHAKTVEYGCADGAGGNERGGGGSGGRGARTAARDADGTEVHAVIQGASDAGGAGHAALPQQRTRASVVAAQAPPAVPGHLADRQRSPEVDPYSPDPRLYPPEWLAELDRRCAEAVAEMTAAIERARDGR